MRWFLVDALRLSTLQLLYPILRQSNIEGGSICRCYGVGWISAAHQLNFIYAFL
jgi:hypothetical protein